MFGRNSTRCAQPRGSGLGFRGNSPPYPYIGRGKGGLPRCQYPGNITGLGGSLLPDYQPHITREQELGFLKTRAGEIKQELDNIESRIHNLEANKKE